ncbi:unnamed protein product [Phytophthora fragariaefolia]|uniref:Unnamed protein product n=1 Tax=Phytophthora fragariaefolia TaxID=1490495 RepID=A0A9W7D2Z9_9STRA|nr:unnamed protein product [Phytophthora fragariaefolia]
MMGTLLRELEKCCVHESTKPQIFRDQPEPSKSIQRRAKQLANDGVLVLGNLAMDQMDPNVLAGFSLRVHSACGPRIWIPSRKRTEEYLSTTAQMDVNYARMECAGKPYAGWYVNIQLQHCQCKYWWKFGSCIHLVYAFMVTNRLDSQGKRVLYNRSLTRQKSIARIQDAGEVPVVGASALSGRPVTNGHKNVWGKGSIRANRSLITTGVFHWLTDTIICQNTWCLG